VQAAACVLGISCSTWPMVDLAIFSRLKSVQYRAHFDLFCGQAGSFAFRGAPAEANGGSAGTTPMPLML